jgi:xanthine/uracil permease
MTVPDASPSVVGRESSTREIGWGRAILSGLAVLIVGFAGAVYVPNRILTKALGLTRTAREWLAIGTFFVVVCGLAWALRWLQARKLV